MISSLVSDYKNESVKNSLEADKEYPMSKDTLKANEDYNEAVNKCETQKSGWNIFKAITSDTYCLPFNKSSQEANLEADKVQAKNTYEETKANDEIYQAALQAEDDQATAEKEANQEEVTNYLNKNKTLIIVLIAVVLIILAIAMYLKMHAKPVSESVVEKTSETLQQPKTSGELVVDYDSLLEQRCKEVGISPSDVLSHFSDSRSAYEKINIMVGKGMSGQEILNQI
jgi:hypothetical protein